MRLNERQHTLRCKMDSYLGVKPVEAIAPETL